MDEEPRRHFHQLQDLQFVLERQVQLHRQRTIHRQQHGIGDQTGGQDQDQALRALGCGGVGHRVIQGGGIVCLQDTPPPGRWGDGRH